MRIGKVVKVVDVPRPLVVPKTVPLPMPERVLVPVRAIPKKKSGAEKLYVSEIPYRCPHCGGQLTMRDTPTSISLTCPEHGLVYRELV